MLERLRRNRGDAPAINDQEDAIGVSQSTDVVEEKPKHHVLPIYNHNGHKVTKGIKPEGESGRWGVHPWHFIRISFRSTSHMSMLVNVLWPFVPAAIAIHFARPDLHVWNFALNYIAMVPTANLVGFAGQELARKLPKVYGESHDGSFTQVKFPEILTFVGSITHNWLFLLNLTQVFCSKLSSAGLLKSSCSWYFSITVSTIL